MPRTFAWIFSVSGPVPQIIHEPRVGCGDLKIIDETKLEDTDRRSLDELELAMPAPPREAWKCEI